MLEHKSINSGESHAKTICDKSIIRISGRLVFPIREGARAIILYGVELIRTARVIKVMEQSEYIAHFETERYVYRVSLVPHANVVQTKNEYAKCA